MIFSLKSIQFLAFIDILKTIVHQRFHGVVYNRSVLVAYLKHLPEDSDDYRDTEGRYSKLNKHLTFCSIARCFFFI